MNDEEKKAIALLFKAVKGLSKDDRTKLIGYIIAVTIFYLITSAIVIHNSQAKDDQAFSAFFAYAFGTLMGVLLGLLMINAIYFIRNKGLKK